MKKKKRSPMGLLRLREIRSVLDRRVFVREGRDEHERAIPPAAGDGKRVQLHREARFVVAPREGDARGRPVAIAGSSFGPNEERDFALLTLLTATLLRRAGSVIGHAHCMLAFSRDVRVRGAGANRSEE